MIYLFLQSKDYNGYEKLISGTDGKHIELSRKITKIFAKHGFKINPKVKLFTEIM